MLVGARPRPWVSGICLTTGTRWAPITRAEMPAGEAHVEGNAMPRVSRILSLAAVTLLVAAPVAAQSPAASGGAAPQLPPLPDGWTQVTAGLNSPRGLTVTADGTI